MSAAETGRIARSHETIIRSFRQPVTHVAVYPPANAPFCRLPEYGGVFGTKLRSAGGGGATDAEPAGAEGRESTGNLSETVGRRAGK
jgi:hypothetical protein